MAIVNGFEATPFVPIKGVVLAGGESRRMGRDKAGLAIGGKRLIDDRVDVLREVCGNREVLVSGNVTGGTFITVRDEIKGLGPLGGLYSVLERVKNTETEYLLIIPVDMPALSVDTLRHLVTAGIKLTDADAVAFLDLELPLLLRVSPEVIEVIVALASEETPKSKRSIFEFLSRLRTHRLALTPVQESEFINTNTPEQWRQYESSSLR